MNAWLRKTDYAMIGTKVVLNCAGNVPVARCGDLLKIQLSGRISNT